MKQLNLARLGVLALGLGIAMGAHADGKKDLVAKILQLQQPAIENLARNIAEQPAAQIYQKAAQVVQARIPEAKREALATSVQADMKSYLDFAIPAVRAQAIKVAPAVLGAKLEEAFSEEELKQLVAILESPVNKRFQQLAPEMQKGLTERVVADTKASVQPRVAALDKAVGEKVNAAVKAAGAAAPATKKP